MRKKNLMAGQTYFDKKEICYKRYPDHYIQPWDMLKCAAIYSIIVGVIAWIAGA